MGAPTHLIAGLGNPGSRYAKHRHNVGFVALDAIAAHHALPSFRSRSRFQGAISEGRIGDVDVVALKPETFMNESGRAIGATMRFYQLPPDALIVIHDELDLVPGKVRAKRGGGVAGHNGLRSIRAHIGQDFWRIRIGIGHPGEPERVHGYVLSDFAKTDDAWLGKTIDAVADALPRLLAGNAPDFMSRVALLTQPPKPPKPAKSAKAEDPAGPSSPSDGGGSDGL